MNTSTFKSWFSLLFLFVFACSVEEKEFIQPKPVSLEASEIGAVSFRANWQGILTAQSYLIEVATDEGFNAILPNYRSVETTENSLLITELEVGQTYFYRVRAKISDLVSSPSNTIRLTTNVSAFGTVTALLPQQITLESFVAKWRRLSDARNYVVDVSTDVDFSTILSNYRQIEVQDTSLIVDRLQPNITYFYRVRAKRNAFVSLPSNIISAKTNTLDKPNTLLAKNIELNSFVGIWSKVAEADEYVLDVAQDANFQQFLPDFRNLILRDTSRIIRNLAPKTNYFYRVRAKKGNFFSDYSNIIGVQTNGLEPPIIASATDIDFNSFRARWEKREGADSYFLEVAEDFGFSKILADYNAVEVRDTFRIIRNLEVGKSYFYRVRARKDNFTSANSNISSVNTRSLTGITALPATEIGINRFVANWLKSDDFDSYIIEVSDIGDFSKLLSGFAGLRIVNNSIEVTAGLNAGKTYYYRVKGLRGNTMTEFSNVIAVTTRSFDAPVALAASNATFTSLRANWQMVAGATSYLLEVATDANFTSLLLDYAPKEIVGTSEVINGLSPQRNYFYRIRAKGLGTTSPLSNVISAVTNAIATPVALDATSVLLSSFQANWQSVAGATSYLLEISTNIAFSNRIAGYSPKEIVGTSEIVTGLSAQTTYYYRVTAKVASGATSAVSNVVPVVTGSLSAPTALAATSVTITSFRANWSAVATASSYLLTVALDVSFTNIVAGYNDLEVNATSLIIAGLMPNAIYYYRVKSKSGSASSTVSNIITVTTSAIDAPVALAATNILATGFQANWQSVTNANSYFLDVATDVGFTTFVTGYNAKEIVGLNEVLTGLSPATTYYYRLRARGLGSFSNYSTIIVVATAPLTPTAIAATVVSSARFTARWNAVAGATSYLLDVSTNNTFTGILPNYNGLEIFATTQLVNVPNIRVTYYYRVRSRNGTSASANSNTITVTNGVNSGANVCKLTSFQLLPNTANTVSFTYPSVASTLVNRITNTELDIRFDITYMGNLITQALLRQNSGANPLYQTWIFTYDAFNNVSTIRIDDAGGTFVELWRFSYDAENKITNWERCADALGIMVIENREYRYAPTQLSPNEIVNLSTTTDEYDLVYDTWASPFLLLSKDLAVMVNYTTTTKPSPATPDPAYVNMFPFLPTRNIVTETFNPTSTTNNYVYTRTTVAKSVATTKRLGATTATYSFVNCAL
jgi:phosphodiesterase/alkaline phosphatase D-like protein